MFCGAMKSLVVLLALGVWRSSYAATGMTTTTGVPATTVAPCEDIDSTACQLMHKSRPDMCSDPTIADNACKRYCGLCPVECFMCANLVSDMTECNTTVTCDQTHDCYTMEVLDFDQGHKYKAGCIDKNLCLPTDGAQVFGRRSSSHVHLHCCDQDRCNSKDQFITTTTTTTALPIVTTTTDNHANCYDTASDCGFLGGLACSFEPKHCRKTCGLC